MTRSSRGVPRARRVILGMPSASCRDTAPAWPRKPAKENASCRRKRRGCRSPNASCAASASTAISRTVADSRGGPKSAARRPIAYPSIAATSGAAASPTERRPARTRFAAVSHRVVRAARPTPVRRLRARSRMDVSPFSSRACSSGPCCRARPRRPWWTIPSPDLSRTDRHEPSSRARGAETCRRRRRTLPWCRWTR
jgi:hypothetical protein